MLLTFIAYIIISFLILLFWVSYTEEIVLLLL